MFKFKYPNLAKYFNKVPAFFYLMSIVVIIVVVVIFSIENVKKGEFGSAQGAIYVYLLAVWFLFLSVFQYFVTLNFEKMKMGKHISKYYTDKECMESVLARIDEEFEDARYMDVRPGIIQGTNFAITKNWIIGTDGVMLMQANAVRIASLRKIDYDILEGRKGRPGARTSYCYHLLKLTDEHDYTYSFYLRDYESLQQAFSIVMYIVQNELGYTANRIDNGK